MEKEYNRCVHIVMHQLRCGGYGGTCQWVKAFLETCTGQIMSKCWVEEEAKELQEKQTEMLKKNELFGKCSENAEDKPIDLFIKHLRNPSFLSKSRGNEHSFMTELLRLG